MIHPNASQTSGATLSACQTYRYHLWRRWNTSLPSLTFIMLNPSTADETSDDPTIRRIKKIATELGYGGLDVLNVYAYRTPSPKALTTAENPHGPENTTHIANHVKTLQGAPVILAWGNHANPRDTTHLIHQLQVQGAKLMALKITKSGNPMHPLFSPTPPRLVPFPKT